MIVPHRIQLRFDEVRPHVLELGKRVHETIFNFCDEQGFAYLKRLKTVESTAEKVESGRYAAWSQLDDLFACTIVIPTLEQEPMALDFLRCKFDVIDERLRGQTQKSPDVFRFDNARFIGRLRAPAPDLAAELIFTIPFEVQIKTAFEHAWSTATHKLVYKSQEMNWKRLRLAAQIKASVEQLDLLIQAFDQHSKLMTESPWRDVEQKGILVDMVVQLRSADRLPAEIMPKDLSRFADNVFTLARAELGRRLKQKAREQERPSLEGIIEQANKAVIDRTLNKEDFPRQLSMFQYVFGILSESGVIAPTLPDYHAVITTELLERYPSTQRFDRVFAFDD